MQAGIPITEKPDKDALVRAYLPMVKRIAYH